MQEGKTPRPRTPGLRGYRPDSGTVRALLRGRRTEPVHPKLTLEDELRICVQFVTNDEVGITQLRDRARIARQGIVDLLAGWGIDRRGRNVIPRNEAERQILAGRAATDQRGAVAA